MKREVDPKRYKRETEPEFKRSLPSAEDRKRILEMQEGRCFYCSKEFGERYWYKGRYVRLKLHWDHMVPFVYSQNNHGYNFAAACHVCNGIKGALMFHDVEQAQVHILQEWDRRKSDKTGEWE